MMVVVAGIRCYDCVNSMGEAGDCPSQEKSAECGPKIKHCTVIMAISYCNTNLARK